MTVDLKICEELASALEAAPREERAGIIEEYCSLYKVSRGTAYRRARAGGLKTGREGAGGPKRRALPTEKLDVAARLIHETATQKYSPMLTTERAIRIGEMNGFWQPGEISVAMLNEYLRENCPRRPPQVSLPNIPRCPDYVNQFGQFDVSNCAQWYLQNNGGVGSQDPKIYWTKNKRGKGPAIKRAIYCEVVTHSFYVEYFCGAESVECLLPIVWRAWMPKGRVAPDGIWESTEEKYPLKGMPEIFLADKGSGLKNGYCEHLFENLGVEFRTHAAGNPQAKGSVERLMFYVEREIEALLRFEPATSIEDLNRKVHTMLIDLNGTKIHTRYGMPRSMAFASWVRSEHLRLPPATLDHFLSLAYREQDVVVNSQLGIRFKGEVYSFLGDSENHFNPAVSALKGQKVTVMHSPFDRNRVKVLTAAGDVFYPARVSHNKYGYSSVAIRMKAPALAPELAKPEWAQKIDALQERELPANIAAIPREDDLKNLRFMVKPAQEFVGPVGQVGQVGPGIPRLEAKRRLQELIGRKLEREESEELNATWSEFVTEQEIQKTCCVLRGEERGACYSSEHETRNTKHGGEVIANAG